ncbi:MAG: hypothetical protein SNJ78_07640, partial [Spirochaetales bacterium]
MVILRIGDIYPETLLDSLPSFKDCCQGLEVTESTLESPLKKSWISLLKGFKGTRVLSILKETAPSRWKEKDLFHYIRLPYTLRFTQPYW